MQTLGFRVWDLGCSILGCRGLGLTWIPSLMKNVGIPELKMALLLLCKVVIGLLDPV